MTMVPAVAEEGGPTSLKWCTYNIQHHGGGRLQLALKAMCTMGFDFGFLTETKIENENYARLVGDYRVYGSHASNHQGGVALFWKEDNDRYAIESVRGHGPNVVSFQLVTGKRRWKVVGLYIPPSETDGATLRGAGEHRDLRNSGRSVRDTEIATVLANHGLDDMGRHFLQRTKHRRRWTWKQRREGQSVRGRCDAIMGTDRRHFTKLRILNPPGYDSDHLLITAEIVSSLFEGTKDPASDTRCVIEHERSRCEDERIAIV